MRALRTPAGIVGVVALLALASCGGDDGASGTTTSTTPATTTTEPPATTTTGPTSTTTTEPASTTTTTSTTTSTTTTTEPAPTTTTPFPPPTTTGPVPTTTVTEPVDVRVYFLRGEQLVIAHRDVTGPAVLRGALTALLEGPDDDLFTAIPAGTRLLDVALADGLATVDLSGEFESGGGTLSMQARVGQVVFTATQFHNVDEVRFRLDGRAIDYLGGEGLVMSEPWDRSDVARDLTGGVLVDTPHPGDAVTSPFLVTGEADVYEGDFPIEVRRGGETIAFIAPVRGGAWGAWGDFTATVTVDAEPGPIELVAYDEGGCGDDPECPPIVETVVPLVLR